MDFLFHKVSEKEKKDIKEQAKQIMDNFSKKLSKIDKKIKKEQEMIERKQWEREESGKAIEIDRNIVFENSPLKDKEKNFIIAEKKKW